MTGIETTKNEAAVLEKDCAQALLIEDFRARSEQMTQLSLDNSRQLRLALLVWAAPLAVLTALSQNELSASPPTPLIMSLSCLIACVITIPIVVSMTANRKTVRECAVGVNFLRASYFAALAKHGWKVDENMASAVGAVKSGDDYTARARVPKGNGWDILACIAVSSIYAFAAVVLSARFDCSPLRPGWLAVFAGVVCVVHFLLYYRSANGTFLETLSSKPSVGVAAEPRMTATDEPSSSENGGAPQG